MSKNCSICGIEFVEDNENMCCGAEGETCQCHDCCPKHRELTAEEEDRIDKLTAEYEAKVEREYNESLASYWEGYDMAYQDQYACASGCWD